MSQYKAMMFDLDGTLLDTIEDIANSMNRVLAKMNYPTHPISAYNYFAGSGVYELTRRALVGAEERREIILEVQKGFNEDYDENWGVKTKPYAGIIEVLRFLESKNISISILSNKPDLFCNQMAKFFFSEIKFDLVRGQVSDLPRKPDPAGGDYIVEKLNLNPEEVLYLGDSDVDMKTALNCGFFGIGAEWGFRTKKELELAGSKYTAKNPQELLTYLKEIL